MVGLKCDKTHIFHKSCLSTWTMQAYTCPVCREPIIRQLEDIEAYKQLSRINQMSQFEDVLAEAYLASSNAADGQSEAYGAEESV